MRRGGAGNYYDSILVLISSQGTKAVSIANGQNNSGYDMYSASNGLLSILHGSHEDYFFAGHSRGFKTKYQENISEEEGSYDSYVYRMNFNDASISSNCLYQTNLLNNVWLGVERDTSANSEVFTFIDMPEQLNMPANLGG